MSAVMSARNPACRRRRAACRQLRQLWPLWTAAEGIAPPTRYPRACRYLPRRSSEQIVVNSRAPAEALQKRDVQVGHRRFRQPHRARRRRRVLWPDGASGRVRAALRAGRRGRRAASDCWPPGPRPGRRGQPRRRRAGRHQHDRPAHRTCVGQRPVPRNPLRIAGSRAWRLLPPAFGLTPLLLAFTGIAMGLTKRRSARARRPAQCCDARVGLPQIPL